MDLAQYEQLQPRCEVKVDGQVLVYATPTRATKWRVDTLFTKEPVTIEWLNALGPDDVLADVGANVGMYTIYAARLRGARVWAFEPESQNYALLNRNIVLNDLGGRVHAFCLALSDRAAVAELHLSRFEIGGSVHSFGEKVDFNLAPRAAAYSQGCVSARLDDLVASGAMPQPTHIKMDVDGIEHLIIAGAREVLRAPRLKSLIIEVNANIGPHQAMLRDLAGLGWRYDPAQAASAARKDGAFKGVGEIVFTRA